MKVLKAVQIRELDAQTIAREPISSVDLMERAASSCSEWIQDHFGAVNQAFIVCGTGNNGGDGLVIARLLACAGWSVELCYSRSSRRSPDFDVNLVKLSETPSIRVHALDEGASLPVPTPEMILIDALFGTGIKGPLTGTYAAWVTAINNLPNLIVSIDMPSGLMADEPTQGPVVDADFTLSFEVPKRAFLVPENQHHVGEWCILPIGLDEDALDQMRSDWTLIDQDKVAGWLNRRSRFDHKGTFGHAAIVAGSEGKAGAAILCAMGALRGGAGLVSVHVPGRLVPILQTAVPEAMVIQDSNAQHFTRFEVNDFAVVAVGCGIGQENETQTGVMQLVGQTEVPLVMDADALNLVARNPGQIDRIPSGTILTPHLKEFDRLFGPSRDQFARLEKLQNACRELQIVIVLKGAFSAVGAPDGSITFNTTGNPGMATAGSGDVLTGIIAAMVSQGYSAEIAARLGVYVHGLAGDFAAESVGYEALIARDIVEHLGMAFRHLHQTDLELL